jgi:dihydrofolate reductase
MRKVMFAMNISIDGCYEHTHFAPDEELMDYFTRLMRDTGLIVYGRKTYELMVPYWPEVAKNKSGTPGDIAFAEAMAPIEKIVLSRTLKKATYNTRIVSENPRIKTTTWKKNRFQQHEPASAFAGTWPDR